MSEEDTKPSVIYTNESGAYDVQQLSDEAKQAFQLLLEVNNEVNVLNRRLSVLQAAGLHLNTIMQDHLDETALIVTNEDSETEEN
tara:strand:- start:1065 stop:1319 length:255 start_codon:yes stop_codon:yes gene_type:complete